MISTLTYRVMNLLNHQFSQQKLRSILLRNTVSTATLVLVGMLCSLNQPSYAQSSQCREERLINYSTSFFTPNHTRGDAEYNGHGPEVEASVRLRIDSYGQSLVSYTVFRAVETTHDWTTAQGDRSESIYFAPRGTYIRGILSDTQSDYSYTDRDHTADVYRLGSGELVESFRFVGDSSGLDAGRTTGVQAFFNPIYIELCQR